MICSECHTPDRLGYLNWPMDKKIINSFITGGTLVVDGGLTVKVY